MKEPERVRKLLQGSANLEFWETYNLPEIYQQLVAADNMLATILKSDDTAAVGSDTTAIEATEEVVADNAAAETTNDADSLLAKIGEDKPEAQAAKSMEEFAKQHPRCDRRPLCQPHCGRPLPAERRDGASIIMPALFSND